MIATLMHGRDYHIHEWPQLPHPFMAVVTTLMATKPIHSRGFYTYG